MKSRSLLPFLALPLAAIWMVHDRFFGLWSRSVDLGLHRIKTIRIAELGVFHTAYDAALGPELSAYARWAHILAALVGKLTGSWLVGVHTVALAAVAVLWGCLGLGLSSLPRRAMYRAFVSVMLALVVNAGWIGLELHGSEIVGNYFFSHLVSQSAVIASMVAALWLERRGLASHRVYIVLGVGVLIADHLHFTPAVVLLGLLALLVLVDFLAPPAEPVSQLRTEPCRARSRGPRREKRRKTRRIPTTNDGADAARSRQGEAERVAKLAPGRRRRATAGALVVLAATALTVIGPSFRMIIRTAHNNGYLALRYIGNVRDLAVLCLLVIVLSATTIAFWFRHAGDEQGKARLLFKYLGLYGLASALLCSTQIGMLALGSGSEYACRKYAFALNTALLLELALLPVALVKRWWHTEPARSPIAGPLLSALLLILAMRLALPDAKASDLRRLLRDEQALFALTRANEFGHSEAKLDFVVGLGDRTHDYLFNVSHLSDHKYQYDGLIELLEGKPFSRPELVGRLASRLGSPWDVPACRLRPPLDGLVVLNATCVLSVGARPWGGPTGGR